MVRMVIHIGNDLGTMEVYRYPIREAFPELREQKDSETKLKSPKWLVYRISV